MLSFCSKSGSSIISSKTVEALERKREQFIAFGMFDETEICTMIASFLVANTNENSLYPKQLTIFLEIIFIDSVFRQQYGNTTSKHNIGWHFRFNACSRLNCLTYFLLHCSCEKKAWRKNSKRADNENALSIVELCCVVLHRSRKVYQEIKFSI